MAHHEIFEQQLIEVLQRSSKHYMGWLTATQEHPSITPMGLRTLLWSMREDGVISQAELTAMLAQLHDVTGTDQPREGALHIRPQGTE
jgi:hypothetical protein